MNALLAATGAELTKIRTRRSVWVITGIILTLQVLVLAQALGRYAQAVAGISPDGIIEVFAGQPEPAVGAMLQSLVGSSFQMTQFLPVIAAVIAGEEFRGRQLGLSVLAVPRRGRLLVAKSLAASAHLLLTAVLVAAISTAFTYLAVKDWKPGLVVSADAFAGQAKFVGYTLLSGLITFALTIIARSVLTGIVITVALLAVTLSQALAAAAPALDALFPLSAGRNLLLEGAANDLTAGPVHALAVLIGWSMVTTLVAGLTLRRDAR